MSRAPSKALPPKEITVSVTGKIPRRNFENYSPFYSIKEYLPAETTDQARLARQKDLQAQCEQLFNTTRDSIRVEELQTAYKNLRFTLNQNTGKKYPHVTDILYWDAEFYMNPEELAQYGARGSAVHSMIDWWIKTKNWDKTIINKRDLILLKTGSLNLYETLDEINFLGFMEKHGKDFEFGEGEFQGFNEEHFYCGRLDRIGSYQGVPAIIDWKCTASRDEFFKQLAMYLKMDDPRLKDIKRMVIVPLNSANKSGYGKPVVSDEAEKYFDMALRDRHDFRAKFGV